MRAEPSRRNGASNAPPFRVNSRYPELRQRPHGSRASYNAGCRCGACREAHTAYQRYRRESGEPLMVDADQARRHLQRLSQLGIGRRAVSDATDIDATAIRLIKSGRRTVIRASTEAKILAVDAGARAGNSLVPASKLWALLNPLLAQGYSRAQLARWLGYRNRALQFASPRVTAKSLARVQRMVALIEQGKLRRDR